MCNTNFVCTFIINRLRNFNAHYWSNWEKSMTTKRKSKKMSKKIEQQPRRRFMKDRKIKCARMASIGVHFCLKFKCLTARWHANRNAGFLMKTWSAKRLFWICFRAAVSLLCVCYTLPLEIGRKLCITNDMWSAKACCSSLLLD